MAVEHLRVVPVRVTRHSEELRTDVRRVVGYCATNGDDWTGPTRRTRQDAVADLAERKAAGVRSDVA
jgi:hypothetical protein